jgi:serine/threonine protein kinase
MAWQWLRQGLRKIGRYEVLGKLGKGSTGSVYKARDPETEGLVAIKLLAREVATSARLLKRFEQEFLATRHLDSPHITRALDFGRDEQLPYLVMEFVDGHDLWEHIRTRGRLPEAEAVRLIAQVADALHQAHEAGIIHRDVKPENILVTAAGQAKLTDFGLVKDLNAGLNLTETAAILGTPNFMAPEQFEDAKRVDRRCDVYGLAATLYMTVTGEVPFLAKGYLSVLRKKLQGELTPPRQLAPGLSVRAEAVIARALSVDPANRPGSCAEFIRNLTGEGVASSSPAVSGETPRAARPVRPERRSSPRVACSVPSDCRPVGDAPRVRWRAQIQDVSATGIGLLLTRRFEPGTVLVVQLRGVTCEAPRRFVARVVHVCKQPRRRWMAGCRLFAGLTAEEIRDLQEAASAGTRMAIQVLA